MTDNGEQNFTSNRSFSHECFMAEWRFETLVLLWLNDILAFYCAESNYTYFGNHCSQSILQTYEKTPGESCKSNHFSIHGKLSVNFSQSCFSSKPNIFSGDTLYVYGSLYNVSLITLLDLSVEGLHRRYWLLCVNILQRYWNLRHPT